MIEIILEKEIVHVLGHDRNYFRERNCACGTAVSEGNSLITNSQVTWLHLVEVVGSSSDNQDAEKFFLVHMIHLHHYME